jgi:hypothetical protein
MNFKGVRTRTHFQLHWSTGMRGGPAPLEILMAFVGVEIALAPAWLDCATCCQCQRLGCKGCSTKRLHVFSSRRNAPELLSGQVSLSL